MTELFLDEINNINSLFTKSVVIVPECISDHNDTNKRNNCLNFFRALKVFY